jgi:hypothetical protein
MVSDNALYVASIVAWVNARKVRVHVIPLLGKPCARVYQLAEASGYADEHRTFQISLDDPERAGHALLWSYQS